MLTHPEQCRGCRHLQRRGGAVLPPSLDCVVVDEANALSSTIGRMLQAFASDGRCPEAAPYDVQPDSYLSEDLIPASHLKDPVE